MNQKKWKAARIDPKDRTETLGSDFVSIEEVMHVGYDRGADLYYVEYVKADGPHDGYVGIEDAHEIAKAKGVKL